jgi:hypothetical protein
MTDTQRQAGMALLRASLSAKGLALTDAIHKTDQACEINDDPVRYDEQLYFFTVMDSPRRRSPGDGSSSHHLVISYFVLGDQVVMTPLFVGANPPSRPPVDTPATRSCRRNRTAGRLHARAPLTTSGRHAEPREVRDDLQAGMNQDNLGSSPRREGRWPVGGAEVPLRTLISLYVDNVREDRRACGCRTWTPISTPRVAWTGGTTDADPFYYHPQPGRPDQIRPSAPGGL